MDARTNVATRPGRVVATSDKIGAAEIYVQSFTGPERLRRAAKWCALCWACAIPAALIPVLHFVLVPGLLVAGPIVGALVYRREHIIVGGKGECPECQGELLIEKGPVRWPLHEICKDCRAPVEIQRQ